MGGQQPIYVVEGCENQRNFGLFFRNIGEHASLQNTGDDVLVCDGYNALKRKSGKYLSV